MGEELIQWNWLPDVQITMPLGEVHPGVVALLLGTELQDDDLSAGDVIARIHHQSLVTGPLPFSSVTS